MPRSCALLLLLLGGFVIRARVALLWQHNANAKCQRVRACTRSMLISVFVINCTQYTVVKSKHWLIISHSVALPV